MFAAAECIAAIHSPVSSSRSRQLQGLSIRTASSKSATPTPEFSSNVILRCTFGDDWSYNLTMAFAVAGLMTSPWYGNHS
jgi:hypothetical protein